MPFVTVTRDSVCAGDDVDAPHRQRIWVSETTDPETLLQTVLTGYPLPCIAGGKATWVCKVDGTPIGVVAQQWSRPVVHARQTALGITTVHFTYHAQKEPERFLPHER